jgi:hypothetical protein
MILLQFQHNEAKLFVRLEKRKAQYFVFTNFPGLAEEWTSPIRDEAYEVYSDTAWDIRGRTAPRKQKQL